MEGSPDVNEAVGCGPHKPNLLEEVLFQIGTELVPNFDVRDMQGIAEFLDVFWLASGRGS